MGGTPKRTAVPPPARDAATKTGATRTNRGQRPTRRGRSPAGGGAGAGRGLWAPGGPRVTVPTWQGPSPLPLEQGWWFGFCRSAPLRAGKGNALRFPRPRGTLPPRPVPPTPTEVSARPGGREAPAGGGAGAGRGLWPPAGQGSAWRHGRGDGPCQCSGAGGSDYGLPPRSGRDPEAHCGSPARARRCRQDPCCPHQERSAPAGGGCAGGSGAGRGLFGSRQSRGQPGAVAGAMAPARMRKGRAGGRVSRFSVRQPLRGARFSTLVKALSMAEHGV